MDQGTVLDIGREALTVVATIAGPMLGVALVIGLLAVSYTHLTLPTKRIV